MENNNKFVCRNIMLAAYLLSKENPAPVLEERDDERTGRMRTVFLYDKTDKIMQDFYAYKQDEFIKTLLNNYYMLKKQLYDSKEAK